MAPSVSINRIAGIDVGGTFIKSGLISGNQIVTTRRDPTPSSPVEVIDTLTFIIQALSPQLVGIGMPGLVQHGVVSYPPNIPGWEVIDLQTELRKRVNLPIFVDNDANMVTYGELRMGVAQGLRNVILLTLGTGVGAGLIIDGQLYHGKGYAGEIGHITVEPHGYRCHCGNRGCLEAYVGTSYVVPRVKAILPYRDSLLNKYPEITMETIATAAKQGDPLATEIIDEIAYYLGIGIATLYSIFDPDAIVLGGGVANIGEPFFTKVKSYATQRLYGDRDIVLLPSKLKDTAGVWGAALWALDQYIHSLGE